MSFASKVLYTGDGVTTDFTVTMPYISTSHISVYVNEILQLNPMNFTWSGASTIKFGTAPGDGDAIEIRRWTSPAATLVDFTDGATLRANDLDTAYLHNYYLSQEYADSFNEVINEALISVATGAGIVETEPAEVIAALVNEMINSSAAANLQARITDIYANAEAIITLGEGLQTQINTLAQGVAAAVFVQDDEPVPGVGGVPDPIPDGARWYDSDDNNAPYIYESGAWVSIEDPRVGVAEADIAFLQVQTENTNAALLDEMFVRATETTSLSQRLALVGATNGDNSAFVLDLNTAYVDDTTSLGSKFTSISAAANAYTDAEITSEQIARADADSAIAADVTTLETTVDGHTATLTTYGATLDGIEAEYGVDLDVNGYVTGFRIINGGTPGASAFVIRADNFAIVDTVGGSLTEYVPFEISGGKINMRADVQIDGDLMVAGTINGSALINGTIGSTQIGANAITTTQLNASAVTAAKIAANQITATHIGVGTVAALGITTGSLSVDGTLTVGAAGAIESSGASGYANGTGFFLGYSSGYKFSVGNFSTGNYMKWDGSTLTVKGDLFVGEYTTSTTTLLSATTERSTSSGTAQKKKEFTVDRAGSVNIKFDYKGDNSYTNGAVYVKKNGVTVNTTSVGNVGWTTKTVAVVGLTADDTVELWIEGGQIFTDSPEPSATYCRNVYIQADVTIPADGGTVDLN